jgi:hypothetical protein
MKKINLFNILVLLIVMLSFTTEPVKHNTGEPMGDTLYDPPIGYTTYYHLRMWGEGDRPGADSVNRNLIDIDLYLHNIHLNWLDSIHAHRLILNSLLNTCDALTSGLIFERNRVNDSLGVHYTRITGAYQELSNVASIVGFLEDTVYSHNTRLVNLQIGMGTLNGYINRIFDTLANTPRLNTSNTFTGTNSMLALELKDPGSGPSLTFLPDLNGGSENRSKIKNGKDTILSIYKNNVISYSNWLFKDTVNFTGLLKENDSTVHLVSSFGESTETNLWVASEQNGPATTKLAAIPVTINGVTVYLIYYTPPAK